MATKESALTANQVTLLKEANKEYEASAQQANNAVVFMNVRKKALEDLIVMLCDSAGIDKLKTKIDLERGVAITELEEVNVGSI